VPDTAVYDNAFKVEWELFLKALGSGATSFPWDLLAAARGVQLAEKGLESWKKRAWVDIGPLELKQ
jgi:hypothetical protein